MRNQLRQCYYALMDAPLLGRIVARCAPCVKKAVDSVAKNGRRSLRGRVENLERELASVRFQLNACLALNPDFASSCPSFSIVINTCDRRDFLKKALESASGQIYPKFEIICVNGPSMDGTDELLSAWKSRIRICVCPEHNLSMSRNIGIAAAAGEIIAFMDDDAIAPPDWLMGLARGYADGNACAVGGCIRDHTGVSWQSRICVGDLYGDARHYQDVAEALSAEGPPENWGASKFFSPTGTNVSMRREALAAVGGFDENYAYHLDETDVILRLVKAGGHIRFSETAEITHKLAASSQRGEDHTPHSLYHPARSKTYFIFRHAAPIYGEKLAEKRLDAWLDWLAASARAAFRSGKLDGKTLDRLEGELEMGKKDGLALVARDPALRQDLAQVSPEAFRNAFQPENCLFPNFR